MAIPSPANPLAKPSRLHKAALGRGDPAERPDPLELHRFPANMTGTVTGGSTRYSDAPGIKE